MSEVRGSGQECQTATAQEQWRGATPCRRSGAAAKSARLQQHRNGQEELPKSEVRGGGREELPSIRGQGRQPGGPTPRLRSSGCAGAGGPRGAIPRPRSGAEAGRTPMPKGRRPRGVSPRPRSGAVAENARLQRRRNGREELPKSEVRGGGREELPHVRGQGRRREDQPHVQGAVAARAQDGLENLSHIEDQEGRR